MFTKFQKNRAHMSLNRLCLNINALLTVATVSTNERLMKRSYIA